MGEKKATRRPRAAKPASKAATKARPKVEPVTYSDPVAEARRMGEEALARLVLDALRPGSTADARMKALAQHVLDRDGAEIRDGKIVPKQPTMSAELDALAMTAEQMRALDALTEALNRASGDK